MVSISALSGNTTNPGPFINLPMKIFPTEPSAERFSFPTEPSGKIIPRCGIIINLPEPADLFPMAAQISPRFLNRHFSHLFHLNRRFDIPLVQVKQTSPTEPWRFNWGLWFGWNRCLINLPEPADHKSVGSDGFINGTAISLLRQGTNRPLLKTGDPEGPPVFGDGNRLSVMAPESKLRGIPGMGAEIASPGLVVFEELAKLLESVLCFIGVPRLRQGKGNLCLGIQVFQDGKESFRQVLRLERFRRNAPVPILFFAHGFHSPPFRALSRSMGGYIKLPIMFGGSEPPRIHFSQLSGLNRCLNILLEQTGPTSLTEPWRFNWGLWFGWERGGSIW